MAESDNVLPQGIARGRSVTIVRIAVAAICGLLAVALSGQTGPALAASDRLPIVADIEHAFEGFFVFTTDGSGAYTIYQQVEDATGLSESDDVVCMFHDCLLRIGAAPDSALGGDAERAIGPIRERFRAVRDAYRAMRIAAPPTRPEAAQAWRQEILRVGQCLDHRETC